MVATAADYILGVILVILVAATINAMTSSPAAAPAVPPQATPKSAPVEPARLCNAAGEVMQWPCKYVRGVRSA